MYWFVGRMEPEICRFIILDFGYPMMPVSMHNIINSLENALRMASACPGIMTESFGISILNTDLVLFESKGSLRQNFESIFITLTSSLTTSKKITVQEFKYLLSRSLERISREFQKFRVNEAPMVKLMEIAILSNKRASVLSEIIMDVTKKLQENFPASLVKSYKLIQILTRGGESAGISSTKPRYSVCFDDTYDISCFFKRWLLGHSQELSILLSKELGLELHCYVEDCVLFPTAIVPDGKLDMPSEVAFSIARSPTRLKVVHRLPVTCYTFKYFIGVPRCLTPAQSLGLKWKESQTNTKIFKLLCEKLYTTGEALLAKSRTVTPTLHHVRYHLLTSDGNILLMNDVATKELFLPPGEWAPTSDQSCIDQTVASKVDTCFEKIKRVDEYDPRHYSSRVYGYLNVESEFRNPEGSHQPTTKSSQSDRSKLEEWDLDLVSNLYSSSDQTPLGSGLKPRKRKPSTGSEKKEKGKGKEKAKEKEKLKEKGKEKEKVHPALLSDTVIEKYRKIHAQAFELLELRRDFNN